MFYPVRPGQLVVPVVSTTALVFYMFHLAETARIDAKASFALVHLKKCALAVVGRLNSDAGGFCYLSDDRRLRFDGSGVCNLVQFMLDVQVHRSVTLQMERLWQEMKDESVLTSDFASAGLLDLVVFLSKSVKFKRKKTNRPLSQHGTAFHADLRNAVVKLLASTIDVVVMNAQLGGDIDQRSVPSRSRRPRRSPDASAAAEVGPEAEEAQSGSRPRKGTVKVDLETVWNMFTHSNELGLSLPVYVETKAHDPQGGCHGQAAQLWMRKIHNIYAARCALSFKDSQLLNVSCDASRFSARDTLVSVCYSPDNDLAAYMNNQFLRSGKLIGPDMAMALEESIQQRAAQRKVERQSSYLLAQAVSAQINHLTAGEVNLESFDLLRCNGGALRPMAAALRPLDPSKLWVTARNQLGELEAFIQDKRTQVLERVDLTGHADVRVLTLCMDQGTSGMAVASFLGGSNPKSAHMVHCTWDGFHRMANDMKLAMNVPAVGDHDLRQKIKSSLKQAHLCSTFLWSINYKPFSGSAFHQSKMELLEHFLAMEDQDLFVNGTFMTNDM